MSDEPIEPTIIQLSSERDDDGAPDPAPAAPPPPTEPPTAGIPPQPPGPGSWWRTDNSGAGSGPSPTPPGSSDWNGGGGAAPAPSAGGPWGRGGAATMTAPAPPAPVTYVDAHELVAALTAAPAAPRFDIRQVRPIRNGFALLLGGLLARGLWNPILHLFGDEPGVVVAGLAGSFLLEYCYHDHRKLRWLVRVHTCSWIAAGIITPAGLLGIAFIGTGVQ